MVQFLLVGVGDRMDKNVLAGIKGTLENHVGKKLYLKANSGRRKVVERVGVLESTYPSLFIVRLDEGEHTIDRVSYSYADVLTEVVELALVEGDDERVPVTYG
ncbi:MAG: hypothetical protein RLZ12_797 [Bacillota bacterium]|jgi:uncharacterized protein Veg